MYNYHRRIVLESTAFGLSLLLLGVNIALIIVLWRAPRADHFRITEDELPVKRGTIPLYILTPIVTLILASVNSALYRVQKITLVYPVIMASIQLASWSTTLGLWSNCNYWGEYAFDLCYTLYLDRYRFPLWEGGAAWFDRNQYVSNMFSYDSILCILMYSSDRVST
ncbi:uncharacterized protein EI97DRAFT_60898 [Westerdykella ornata]|uniref:Uncharacterized protein n=1 Tax=Westerdykella ornata TaxID=318751 RepID=A0A6A6JI67_WESOR|nr:uncharacterized protein EI97DRAFT_60898 [Westerdykella ornata]KAF2275925.1 hypothetical protein EI97DRAFT_60898 [Westerdykella ornata]